MEAPYWMGETTLSQIGNFHVDKNFHKLEKDYVMKSRDVHFEASGNERVRERRNERWWGVCGLQCDVAQFVYAYINVREGFVEHYGRKYRNI